MEEKKKTGLTISKAKSYSEHKCKLGLDKEREKKFNKGEKITVTKQELKSIGEHRWLI